jgi:hypothetical protein
MSTRLIAALALCGAATIAQAQAPAVPTEFPSGAQPLTAESLQQRLSGKVFNVKTANGGTWRLQYEPRGYFYINVGSYSDSGNWRVDGSQLCAEPQKSKAGCNEMRLAGESLYLKRDSGEIIKFEPN